MREEKRWCRDSAGAPAPPPLLLGKGKRKEEQQKKLKWEKQNVKKEGEWCWERQIIYPTIIIISPAVLFKNHGFILRSLYPLWVMSGSNWGILLTFASLCLHMSGSICTVVPQVPFLGYVIYNIPSHSIQLRKHF